MFTSSLPSPAHAEEEEAREEASLRLAREIQAQKETSLRLAREIQAQKEAKEKVEAEADADPCHVIVRTFDRGKLKIPFSKFGEEGNPLEGINVSPDDVRSLTFSKDIDYLSGDNYWRKGFKNLTSVDFERGSKLHTIGNYCFTDCSNLSSIVFPEKLVTIGACALDSTNVNLIRLPASVKNVDRTAFSIDTLRMVIVPRGILRFYVGEGVHVITYDNTEKC